MMSSDVDTYRAGRASSDVPGWFSLALSAPVSTDSVTVDGAKIGYRAWGIPGSAGLVLVHGGGAHSRWWDHIAPMLAQGKRVVALDLSGHGDSDRRQQYLFSTWADEVMAVAQHSGIVGPPIVIGHSMGGMVTLETARLYGNLIAGAVAIDSPISEPTPEVMAAQNQRAFGPLRRYPTAAAAQARFRPVPDQPCLSFVKEHIAQTSVIETADGWTWKFDPRLFQNLGLTPAGLTRLECRFAFLRCEFGLVSTEMGEMVFDRLGRVAPIIEIPAAGHHVMLDEPLALVTGLRVLLSDWQHSIPILTAAGSR